MSRFEDIAVELESGKHADKLKALQGVGIGFVDGDIELL